MSNQYRTVYKVLHDGLPANAYVIIRESGWRVGMVWIDYEDLWARSLSRNIADLRVKSVTGPMNNPDFTVPVYEIDAY